MKLICTIAALIFATQTGAATDSADKQLGTVLGQPVMSSQLGDASGYQREQKMRNLFVRPLFNKWKDEHPDAVTPTAKDEAKALACARKALDSSRERKFTVSAQELVDFQLAPWKFQQSIYRAYGGGSTLFQQAGIEAYGATRRFLEEAENNGEISFKNKATRKTVYAYWNLGKDDFRVQSGPEYAAFFDAPPPCGYDEKEPAEPKN